MLTLKIAKHFERNVSFSELEIMEAIAPERQGRAVDMVFESCEDRGEYHKYLS